MRLTIEWSRDRIPLRPLGNFGNFLYPTLPVSFGRDTKSHWSLLSGAYARGSKISHTGGKCVTCCGLRPCSTWSIMSKTTLIKYSVKVKVKVKVKSLSGWCPERKRNNRYDVCL